MQATRALGWAGRSASGVVSGIRRWRGTTVSTLRHPLATEAGILAVSQYAAAAIGLVATVVAARLLGPAEYGAAALLIAYPTLIWSLVTVKSSSVTTRYLAIFQGDRRLDAARAVCKLGFVVDLVAACIAFAVVTATMPLVAGFHGLVWPGVVYAASLPFLSLSGTSSAILTCSRRFGWLAGFQLLEKVVALTAMLAFIAMDLGAPGVVLALASAHSLSGILSAVAATVALQRTGAGFWWHGSLRTMNEVTRELVGFFGWNYAVVTLGGVLMQGPLLLLGRACGTQAAGFYRLATSIATTASYLETSLSRAVYPRLAERSGSSTSAALLEDCRRLTLYGGIPIGLLLVAGIGAVPFALPPLLGGDYHAMSLGTQFMILGSLVGAVFFWLQPLYYATRRLPAWTVALAVQTAAMLVIAWVFSPSVGFTGIAAAMGGTRALTSVLLAAGAWRSRGFE